MQVELAQVIPTGEQLSWQLVLNYFGVVVIQWMKKSNWRLFGWITDQTPKISKLVAVVLAALTAVGITHTFDPTAGRLVIEGLTIAGLVSALKEVVQNYIGLKVFYNLTSNTAKLPSTSSGQ